MKFRFSFNPSSVCGAAIYNAKIQVFFLFSIFFFFLYGSSTFAKDSVDLKITFSSARVNQISNRELRMEFDLSNNSIYKVEGVSAKGSCICFKSFEAPSSVDSKTSAPIILVFDREKFDFENGVNVAVSFTKNAASHTFQHRIEWPSMGLVVPKIITLGKNQKIEIPLNLLKPKQEPLIGEITIVPNGESIKAELQMNSQPTLVILAGSNFLQSESVDILIGEILAASILVKPRPMF